MDPAEKEGSLIMRDSQMVSCREALEFCHLGDLGFIGPCFTWCNQRMDHTFTKERPDRPVANPEWCAIFPKVSVLVLPARALDHNPLVVSFLGRNFEWSSYRRGFKYEAWWENDAKCSNVINSSWGVDFSERGSIPGVQACLSTC